MYLLFCSKLDAFIYDGTVLNYLASKDDECRLLQVGSWSRMTGYALAFPRNSKFKNMFDAKILELRENGKICNCIAWKFNVHFVIGNHVKYIVTFYIH